MISIKIDNAKTGWTKIPGTTKKVIVHFNDGNKKEMDLLDFITLGKRDAKKVIQIDCYTESDINSDPAKA